MRSLLHIRGDIPGMLVFFIFLFVGLLQLAVAWKKWNGLSLTGYPDRSGLSCALGLVVSAGSCMWYFTGRNHFAKADMEGVETFIVMAFGLVIAVVFQFLAASLLFRKKSRNSEPSGDRPGAARRVEFGAGGSAVGATYWPPAEGKGGEPVLALHDYGGDERDLFGLALRLSEEGHPVMTLDLDGHGNNPRPLSSPLMEDLLEGAVLFLERESGRGLVAVAGIGLGGTLSMSLAEAGRSARSIALDPPARELEGAPKVNALRELRPPELLRAFARPPARGEDGPIDLAGVLFDFPQPGHPPCDRTIVIGTRGSWFNSPEDLGEFAAACGLAEPSLLEGNHRSLSSSDAAARAVLDALE